MKTISQDQLEAMRRNCGENAWDFHLCLKSLEIIINELDISDEDLDRRADEDLRELIRGILYTVNRCAKPTNETLKEMARRNKDLSSLWRGLEAE